MRRYIYSILWCVALLGVASVAKAQSNVVDEVIWVVGDEAILKSDVESMRTDPDWNKIQGNPYCVIPERIAVQKLFLHQAEIDSIEVTDQEVNSLVEEQINNWVMQAGSKEKLEEYMKSTITQIREDMFESLRNQSLVERMQQKLTSDVKVTPAEVRRYFKDLPEDSLPYINMQVEVEILVKQPEMKQEEIDRVKDALRGYAERVTSGEISFANLARMYSQDDSRRQGGELPYMSRTMLDPAFANVAFSLTDPNKVSKVVESEYGYHIIQLIDKNGDKIKCRHILLKPQVMQEDVDTCLTRLDSLAADIRAEKFPFEAAASEISDDKDTRNNHGLMSKVIATENGRERTSRFTMSELADESPEVAQVVAGLELGEVSKPFQMVNAKGKTVCAIVKLKSRIPAHRASMQEDFQILRDVVLNKKRQEVIDKWISEKQRATYVRINEEWRDCEFQYPGWVK